MGTDAIERQRKARSKKQKRPVEAVEGSYTAFPHRVMDSVAFMGASYPAKALLCEVMRQHMGRNNGHFQLSSGWLLKRGWKSRDVIQRATKELIQRGLLILTRQGGLNMGPSRYALSWLPISNYVGLDIQGKDYRHGAWALMDQSPTTKIACPVPAAGNASTGSR